MAAAGELRAAHQFMRRQLNQMLPLPFSLEDGQEEVRVVFEGDSRRIQYVAPMPGYLGSGGPQVQLIELVQGNDNKLIIQFSHALLQEFEQERLFDRAPVILLEGVDVADFEFLGRDNEGQVTGWTSSWDQTDSLPVAVRLNLGFPDELNLRWPDLVAGVKVDEQAVMGGGGRRGVGQGAYKNAIKDMIKGKDKS